MSMRSSSGAFCLLLGALSIASGGCSGAQPSSGRPEVESVSDEEHFGAASKALLYEFRAKVRKRGVQAAKQELPQLLEAFDGYEKRKLGDSSASYGDIVAKLKALEGTLGSASKDAVVKAANELGTLADKLPGKANPNPAVD
jgi:hypothetical protein